MKTKNLIKIYFFFFILYSHCFYSYAFFETVKKNTAGIFKNNHLLNTENWKKLSKKHILFRTALFGLLAQQTLAPDSEVFFKKKYSQRMLLGITFLAACKTIFIISSTKSARAAPQTITDIIKTCEGKGKIHALKFFFYSYKILIEQTILSTLLAKFFNNIKLHPLTETKKLIGYLLHLKPKMTSLSDIISLILMPVYISNKNIQHFLKKNTELVKKVETEVLLLKKTLDEKKIILQLLSHMLVFLIISLIRNRISLNIKNELAIIQILFLVTKFDYEFLMEKNLYVEFFSILLFLTLRQSEKMRKALAEKENYFSLIDKSMWAEDLRNSENPDINRVANVYFLTKIKKAISDQKKEVEETNCVDFQNFIHASIFTHSFCDKNCQGKIGRNVCQLLSSYGFLNSVSDIFSWMITEMEQNKIIYTFQETNERKPIEYKDLKGETQIKKICIQEEMFTLKNNIKELSDSEKEECIKIFFKEKSLEENEKAFFESLGNSKTPEEKTRLWNEKKRILLEEIKYVLLGDYIPKNHPDFDDNQKQVIFAKNKKKVKKIFARLVKPGLWFLILNFPHEKLHSLLL